MSDPGITDLVAALVGPNKLEGTPQVDGNVRLGQVVSVAGLSDIPPTITVGDGTVSRPMRVAGNLWDYHPGDTVVWTQQTGNPLVVGVLPVVGSETDFTEEDFLPWNEVGVGSAVPFQNGWVNFDGGVTYDTAAYWMQTDGWVRLKGMIKDGTATPGTAIFDLPLGWAPPWNCYFNVNTNNTTGVIQVDTSGIVRAHAAIDNAFVSLDGITFPASWTFSGTDTEKVNYGRWLLPHFSSGWNIDTSVTDSEIEFFLRSDGWCWVKGVLNVAAVPGNAMMLPDLVASGYRVHLMPALGFGISRHDIGGTNVVRGPKLYRVQAGGATGFHYIGGNNWYGSAVRGTSHQLELGSAFSFQNGWTNFGQDFYNCRYYKDVHGVVHVWGMAQGNASSADTIATLPAGFRPMKRQVFNTVVNDFQGRVDILPNGEVLAVSHPNNTWQSLSGIISFRAMQ